MDAKPYFKDYYYVLGVSQDATSEEIQEAYHDLYEKYGPHVSVSGQDPDMLLRTFKDISEAYEMLMDPARRREYNVKNDHHFQKGDLRALWGKFAGSPVAKPESSKGKPASDQEVEMEVT